MILVREKSVKSQGISFQTKSGHPGLGAQKNRCLSAIYCLKQLNVTY